MLAIKGGKPVRTKPWPAWPVYDERETKALEETLKSRFWGGGVGESGPKEKEFEEKFSMFHGCSHGVCVSSGTEALHLALLSIGIGAGDEVIVPALTFWATGSAVLMAGGNPVIVDVDKESYCMSFEEVEKSITSRTKAIISVYNYGNSPDMDKLFEIAEKHGLALIEDCARAHGFMWRNKPAGSIGDIGCFSFQQGKFMTAGEGGIIITNNRLYAERCRALRTCGRIRGDDVYSVGVEYWWNWWNFRMTQFQAAILLVQLERLEEQTKTRQANSEYLSMRLSEIEGITTLKIDERLTRHQPWPYLFKYDSKCFENIPVERFVEALKAEGIPCSTIDHPPLSMTLTARGSRSRIIRKPKYPVAESAIREAVTLPQSIFLGTKEDMDDVVEAIVKIKTHLGEL
ncbi:MAG: DegT/DnrJ/EryC1/StrS family aminotransferase [Thaumarchaeota archaeon]|jgi:dTDP-4-amino-4,6-dideoxygalactose transaminase|nr:DegT/DnrJ/EryC1/StrS family aminotransferase [Nitrososphaerota archaeon]